MRARADCDCRILKRWCTSPFYLDLNPCALLQRQQRAPNVTVIKRLGVADIVPGELERGRLRSRQDSDLLNELVISNLIKIVELEEGDSRLPKDFLGHS